MEPIDTSPPFREKPPKDVNNPAWFKRYENMEQPDTKPAVKSKEIWGAVVKIIGIILAAFGIIYEPQFLLDGWQTADIVPLIGGIGAVLGQFLEKYGARAAVKVVRGVFR